VVSGGSHVDRAFGYVCDGALDSRSSRSLGWSQRDVLQDPVSARRRSQVARLGDTRRGHSKHETRAPRQPAQAWLVALEQVFQVLLL